MGRRDRTLKTEMRKKMTGNEQTGFIPRRRRKYLNKEKEEEWKQNESKNICKIESIKRGLS